MTATANVGGTHVEYSFAKQMLVMSNFKKNRITFFDIRKNSVLKNLDVIIFSFIKLPLFINNFF